jgi:uncharacterized Zn-finger protein
MRIHTHKGALQRHIRIHPSEKIYKCDVCGKVFSRKDSLQSHIRRHSGEKPYKCNDCGEAFSRKDSLQRHIRRHNGEKPYKYNVCGKVFSRKDSLQRHIRKHNGEKPDKCNVCGKVFSHKLNLQKHICHKRTWLIDKTTWEYTLFRWLILYELSLVDLLWKICDEIGMFSWCHEKELQVMNYVIMRPIKNVHYMKWSKTYSGLQSNKVVLSCLFICL